VSDKSQKPEDRDELEPEAVEQAAVAEMNNQIQSLERSRAR